MLFAEFSAIILMMILALMFAFGVLLLGWLIDVILSIVDDLKLLKSGRNQNANNAQNN